MTDIVDIRFIEPEIKDFDQALSILYAIINGTCRALYIEQNDISGCLQWFRNDTSGLSNFGFVLYDKTPGGAGHVKRLLNESVLKSALQERLIWRGLSSRSCEYGFYRIIVEMAATRRRKKASRPGHHAALTVIVIS
ncbi:MAG: DUF1998 domain-containing protein, partial [Oscillospiraceae bacterium]|nr:DUF1998 domain-containing protein [Oscillospiraceae bacterium]